jgi:hypothetical protein
MAITLTNGVTITSGLTISSEVLPPYVTSGLQVYLDASNPASYPGSGTTWTSLVNSYTGTMGAGVTYSTNDSGSMLFNGGVTATVNLLNAEFRALTNNFSVEFWYKSTNNRPGLVANGVGSNGFVFGYFSTSGTAFKVTKYGRVDINAGAIPQNTNWHQAVLTYSSTTGTRVYVDGALSSPTSANTANLIAGSTTFNIGRSESNNHNGSMGIIRWYSAVLSADDVAQNFNADRSRYGI